MPDPLSFDASSFKGLEYSGWQKNAAAYDDLFGSVTRHAMEPLLDAVKVRKGAAVLEVCCGPGYGAGAALERGASAIGIDFSPAMVSAARSLFPSAKFEQGDAEALSFQSDSFDAVICAFGVNHLQNPDAAIEEVLRVTRPSGWHGFTMWCAPGKSKFHGLVLDSVRAHGTLDVPLPPAPPPFRFSDPQVCMEALLRAGFINPTVTEIPLSFRPHTAEQVLALTYSAVRLEMILTLQTAEARTRIHRAIVEGAEVFRIANEIELPMPAILASAQKPPKPN